MTRKIWWEGGGWRLGAGGKKISPDMFVIFQLQFLPIFEKWQGNCPLIPPPPTLGKHPDRARQLQTIVNEPKYTIKSIEVSRNERDDLRSCLYP